jgi:formylglycine-generating enzyme required for sulfatase activity
MIDALKLLGSHAALVGAAARSAEGAAPVVADAESSLWEVIERANTIRDYEAYLAEYPQGRFAALAKTRVKALIEEKLAQEEAALWKAVELTGKKEDLQAYLAKFPEGRNAPTASARLAAILKFEAETAVGRIFSDCPTCPELVILPPGAFDMGSSDGDQSEQPMRRVNIEKFAIGRFEVTQAQWKAIMGQNPSRFVGCDECPVEMVSWDEARSFVLALSVKTGRDYRLPSEAEWEYACRAGGRDTYCGGKDATAVAWVESNSGGFFSTKARETGKLQGNLFKIHDMSGNVWEWVDDCWNDNHLGAPNDAKPRLDGDCGKRVLRGGSRLDDASAVRATKRHRDVPAHRDFVVGLRVAAAVVKR